MLFKHKQKLTVKKRNNLALPNIFVDCQKFTNETFLYDSFFNEINSAEFSINFKVEIGDNNKLAFSDILIKKTQKKIYNIL